MIQHLNSTSLAGFIKTSVKDLGSVLDSELKMDRQINTVVRSCSLHLRLLVKTKPFLSTTDLKKAIMAIVFTQMDYCNSLYFGVDSGGLGHLQIIHNAVARMIKSAKTQSLHDSVTPLLVLYH